MAVNSSIMTSKNFVMLCAVATMKPRYMNREMNRRRAAIDARKETLNSNNANRYYRDGDNRCSHEHYCWCYRYCEDEYE